MNPNGLVPVLRDGEEAPIWETGAILRYLAGRYAAVPFWPEEGAPRAAVDKWADWSKVNVAINFTGPIFWRVVRTAPSRRDPAAIRQAIVELGKFLDIAEARLAQRDFLAGDDSHWRTSSSGTYCSGISTWISSGATDLRSSAITTAWDAGRRSRSM